MSYLLAKTTTDELLLMIAAEDGESPPEPDELPPDRENDPNWYYGTLKGQPRRQAGGFCHLNYTDNLHKLYPTYIYQSPYQGFVIHLTWKGWERVEQLKALGHRLPTAEERDEYGRHARLVVEGGDHGDYIPLDVPNPRGLEPETPKQTEAVSWLKRRLAVLFGVK